MCGKRILLGVIAAVLFATACFSAYAAADEEQTLKVGYMDYHGFIDCEEDETYTGYAVDYLNEISKYTNFRYEYVYGEWADLLDKLERGEIDILCSAQYTKERAEKYDYSAYPVGYTQGLLYTRQDNSELCYEDFEAFDNMTVGTLKNNAMTELFLRYAELNDFSCTMQEYETEGKLRKALDSGEVDAMCSEHLANNKNLSLLANFGADAFYIISYKGNTFMDKIDFALKEIKTNVDFEATLFHTYYDTSAAQSSPPFTLNEREYIKNSGTLVVGLMEGRSPLSYVDKDGQIKGMLVDLMNIVAEESGLKFKYRFLEIGQTGYDFLTNSGGDLVAGVASSAFSTPNKALQQSETLLNSDIVFVGRSGTEFNSEAELTIALPAGFINGDKIIAKLYPNFKYYFGTTNGDCLKAIRDGKADVMLQNMYVIRECLQSSLYEGLDIFPAYSFEEDEKIVALPGNEILMSIIDKSIDAISNKQQDDAVIANTVAKNYRQNLGEIFYKYRLPLAGIFLLIFVIIAMFIGVLIIRQRNYAAMEKVNGQLEEAVRQANRASDAKSNFLSRMSHEIRTPMNAIVGLTEIAKQHENEPEKIGKYLGKIAVSSKVLLNILNDVLDMSAIESDKLKIAFEQFDIKQVLGGISTIYYPQCKGKGITFDMASDVQHEFLVGDSLRVNQILLNLISNAYKFTEPGGNIHLYVKETSVRGNRAFLRFSVADNGCGMSDDMKKRLFKPFEQEAALTAKEHSGSGLGLSITKNLVDMMHGAIRVQSEKGVGTTFEVDLPFEIAENAVRCNSETLKHVKILAVDDDETARDYAETVLRRVGASFDVASSGKEALKMLDEAQKSGNPYNVALIDWKMPDMDGLEVTRKIREQEENKTLIIIVSAYDLNEVQDEAKSAGADHFVTKPLFQSTIFNVLMQLTDGAIETPSGSPQKYDFTSHKVLLAEDQDLNAEIATELLDLVHMSVVRAENGKRAVEIFNASPAGTYDAILMDIQMPEMNGYEAATAIRNLPRPDAREIPIFAMTANAFTEDVAAAMSAGMNGHIAKPIDTNILYKTLYKVINKAI